MANKQIVYRFEVWVTMPLTNDPDHPDFYTEEGATAPARQREMERNIAKHLKDAGDCDVELCEYEVKEEG